MSDPITLSDAVTHSRVIIDGYTNVMFADHLVQPYEFSQSRDTGVWKSEPVRIIQGVMKFVAGSVRLTLTGQLEPADTEGTDASPMLVTNRGDYTILALFIYSKHDGSEFHTGRNLSFRGPYFRHFD